MSEHEVEQISKLINSDGQLTRKAIHELTASIVEMTVAIRDNIGSIPIELYGAVLPKIVYGDNGVAKVCIDKDSDLNVESEGADEDKETGRAFYDPKSYRSSG